MLKDENLKLAVPTALFQIYTERILIQLFTLRFSIEVIQRAIL